MAYVVHRGQFLPPVPAASTIVPRSVVKLSASSPLALLMAASNNDRPFGMIGEATTPQGFPAAVYDDGNIVKAIAAASLGAGTEVGIASIGVASAAQGGGSYIATTTLLGPISAASGVGKWAVGISMDAVAAGEVFSLYVKPRLTGGLA